MSKILHLSLSAVFFQAPNAPKPVFAPGSTPLGEITILPQTPSQLGRGTPLPHTFSPRHLWRLDDGASVLRPLHQNSWLRL